MKSKEDYINYKLQKSAQALKEAGLLRDNKMPDTAKPPLLCGILCSKCLAGFKRI